MMSGEITRSSMSFITTDGQTDATKYIISLASRSIKIQVNMFVCSVSIARHTDTNTDTRDVKTITPITSETWGVIKYNWILVGIYFFTSATSECDWKLTSVTENISRIILG